MTIRSISDEELELSSRLNATIGIINVEMSLLPMSIKVEDWPSAELLRSIVWCQVALIDALRCALQLSQLGGIDRYSRQFIKEFLITCETNQARLAGLERAISNHVD
ncbi:MAG: hypothetical protein HKL85_12535 [Acidimicrobiaceae bacterium]|nr:hypothetical protein [Acidimicrobiaceae bacterium]